MTTLDTRAVVTGRPARGGRRALRRYVPEKRRSWLLTVLLWLCALYFILPLWWLMVASTKDTSALFATFGLWFAPEFSLWDNLVELFTVRGGLFARWMLNTVVYAVVSAVGATLLSAMAGYAFAKYEFPGRRALFSVTLGAVMIPVTALALPTYLLFARAGLTDTPWAIIIPSLVSPFGVYLMRVYAADSIPDSLIEAARVDGAGEFRIFWQVGLRLLGPGLVTVFLFSLVGTWNNYFLPLIMLNTSELYPITVGLAQLQAAASAGGGSQAVFSTVITGSFVSILPLVIAFLFLQRYWQSGLGTGGVKG
ncbi:MULTISPECIES: carbohydrate ABC transporter permease [unclassified Microbacterium]|uniref:carbohydrate ABC transporter permease n=1 Tax=unclassified Microbacterium TaxID=2609290 RepID=UPI00214B4817|nr:MULTISPECIES: carbohydrate ABC transporter permease [unclassified Microbacterium]MCR2783618.1 carbohydrate ABC transporter permease [Microbacterium sp. zg.B96]WIM15524.1 carbohydrate ABC transporter permease [Microbacterium sp. zg-B96]